MVIQNLQQIMIAGQNVYFCLFLYPACDCSETVVCFITGLCDIRNRKCFQRFSGQEKLGNEFFWRFRPVSFIIGIQFMAERLFPGIPTNSQVSRFKMANGQKQMPQKSVNRIGRYAFIIVHILTVRGGGVKGAEQNRRSVQK